MLKLVCSVSLGFRCLATEMCRLLNCRGGFPFFFGCLRLGDLFRFTRKVMAAKFAKFAIGPVFG